MQLFSGGRLSVCKVRLFPGVAVVLLVALMCATIALLSACGGPSNEEADDQATSSATQSAGSEGQEGQDASAEPAGTFEVAGCHLTPEKILHYATIPDNNPEYPGGEAMSFLMQESDVPVQVLKFGATSGFIISLGYEDATADPEVVRFEPLDDVEGYATRVTFYYPGGRADGAVDPPTKLFYKAYGTDSHTYHFAAGASELPVEEADDEWPDVKLELPGLAEGAQTLPLDSELTLAPEAYALHRQLGGWVEDLFVDCRQKLVDEGALDAPGKDDPNEYFVFNDTPELVFKDTAVADRLYADLSVELDDVVFYAGEDVLYPGVGLYLNPSTEGDLAQYPRYYPATHLITGVNEDGFDVPEGKADVFADSLDGCHYVVAYMGLKSRVDKDFYNAPTADRVLATTLVVVMDAQTREFVHIHAVGTVTPELATDAPIGTAKYEEAREYMCTLL